MNAEPEHPVSEEDQKRYREILSDMAQRLKGAQSTLASPPHASTVEYAALQVRMLLELIVMASFVSNRAAIEKITTALDRKDVDGARKAARNANQYYWPKAVWVVDDTTLEGRPDDEVLTEDEWGRAWGKVSDLLHVQNPYALVRDLANAHAEMVQILRLTDALLEKHVLLLSPADYMVMGQITDNEVAVMTLNRAPAGA